MEAANASPIGERDATLEPAALLRGTARGLEIQILGSASVEEIAEAVQKPLDEAPGFFRGSDVRIRVADGPLPVGCLGRLDEIACAYDLRILEVAPADMPDAVPEPSLAAGSAPVDEPPITLAASDVIELAAESESENVSQETDSVFEEPTQTAVPLAQVAAALDAGPGRTRIVVGPVRSGVILDHAGHLIVFGDVNPGAEVRASGNIVVLGRLRGTAHAGIGHDVGFILALRLEPQQLRIGRQVARAGDSDTPAADPEIAYGTGTGIIVERYSGRLPATLATSI